MYSSFACVKWSLGSLIIFSRNHFKDIAPLLSYDGGRLSNLLNRELRSSLESTATPSKEGLSTRSPVIIATSCNVTFISPTDRWNVFVSDLHCSRIALSRGQSKPNHPNICLMEKIGMVEQVLDTRAMSDPIQLHLSFRMINDSQRFKALMTQ